MSYQRKLEVKLLLRLYIRVHEGTQPTSSAQLRNSAKKSWSVSDYRFEDAFQNLLRWKYLKEVEANEAGEMTYRLSSRGIDWVEGWYRVNRGEKDSYEFVAKHKGSVFVDELRYEYVNRIANSKPVAAVPIETHFWTKWGAVAAILAVPTSILVWWLS